MRICGLQKMTILDFPGHVACTVFLGGCDLRCPFCHNYELACGSVPETMTQEALLRFLGKRKGLLDGVAITGGEPCLNQDLPEFLKQVRALGFLTKLDTNGFHPAMLQQILQERLVDYVAMDVKNCPEKYALTCGLPEDRLDLGCVRESIALLRDGAVDYEFRTTVVREFHKPEDFYGIGELISGAKQAFLQQFTDREEVPFAGLHALEKEEMLRCAAVLKPFAGKVEIRGIDV